MTDLEDTLRRGANEIHRLRHQNEILSAKVETMELLAGFLQATLPSRPMGASPDIAWAMLRAADTLAAEAKPANG